MVSPLFLEWTWSKLFIFVLALQRIKKSHSILWSVFQKYFPEIWEIIFVLQIVEIQETLKYRLTSSFGIARTGKNKQPNNQTNKHCLLFCDKFIKRFLPFFGDWHNYTIFSFLFLHSNTLIYTLCFCSRLWPPFP